MKRGLIGSILGAVALLSLAGCEGRLVGRWRSVEPVRVPPEMAYIREVTFQPKGRYEAVVSRGGVYERVSGTYRYDGAVLTFYGEGEFAGASAPCPAELVGQVLILRPAGIAMRLSRESDGAAPPVPEALVVQTQPAAGAAPTDAPALQPADTADAAQGHTRAVAPDAGDEKSH